MIIGCNVLVYLHIACDVVDVVRIAFLYIRNPRLWCVPRFHCVLGDLIHWWFIKYRNVLTERHKILEFPSNESFILFYFFLRLNVSPLNFWVLWECVCHHLQQAFGCFNQFFIGLEPLILWIHHVLVKVFDHLLVVVF